MPNKCPNCNKVLEKAFDSVCKTVEAPMLDRLLELSQCGSCGYIWVSEGSEKREKRA
jgi:hypothetical protein